MTLGKALNDALDAATGPGTIHAENAGTTVDADVVDVDRLGVRVTRLSVRRDRPFDLLEEAKALPERLRSLPEPLIPVEIDTRLGGAVLRTRPDAIDEGEFFELELHGDRDLELRRLRGGRGQDREAADFTLTRKQLGRLVDELG